MSETAFQEAVLTALAEMKSELGSLKSEVGSLKSEVGWLKSEVGSLKAEVAGLKTEVATLSVRVERLEREEFLHYTSLTKDLQQVKGDLHFFGLNFDTRVSALEAQMSEVIRAFRNHEGRITALEARP